jgi:hypothetical protein
MYRADLLTATFDRRLSAIAAAATALSLAVSADRLAAQRPELSPAVRAVVTVDEPVVALTHARLVDGTGAPAVADRTIITRR